MAKKSSDRGGGEGTCDHGGVRSTFDAPFGKGRSIGSQGTMPGPFNAPRSGGENGLPTKVYDNVGGPKSTPAPTSAFTSPSSQGPNRSGTKQDKY